MSLITVFDVTGRKESNDVVPVLQGHRELTAVEVPLTNPHKVDIICILQIRKLRHQS